MNNKETIFERSGGTYTQVGDMLLPDLFLSDSGQRPIGKYGRMRKRYLEENHPVLYSDLILTEKLYPHLSEIDAACEGKMELLVRRMAEREGITEALKADDQMEWVRRMNSIRSRAEEIVMNELIYPEETEDKTP